MERRGCIRFARGKARPGPLSHAIHSGLPPFLRLVRACARRRGTARAASKGVRTFVPERKPLVEVTKALSALQPLYRKDNVEIVTEDGTRVRGVVRSMKTTQALTTPSVKIERPDGEIIKIPFNTIAEIIDHNQ